MIDLGISKLTLIGIVALVVVGPEKLPTVARTLGTLIGRAQRYISDLKAEVGNVAGLNELQKMKQTVEQTAWDLQQQVHNTSHQIHRDLHGGYAWTPSADIEDIAFKILCLREVFDLFDYRLFASASYGSTLMHRDSAKVALAVTAVMGRDRELDSL